MTSERRNTVKTQLPLCLCHKQQPLLQVQKGALQRDYSKIKYEQPYQTALYNQSVLFEAKRWHVNSYEEALKDLTSEHLKVSFTFVCAYLLGDHLLSL